MLLIMTACANIQVKPLDSSTGASLDGKTIVVVNYGQPSFVAMTAGKASFGLFGASAMYQAGKSLMIKHDIKDPAIKIRTNLISELKSKYNLKLSSFNAKALKDKSLSSVLRTYSKAADFIFDYRTFEMGYLYYPTKWDRYKTRYIGIFRLIDVKTKNIIASTNCVTFQGNDQNPPTKKQLLENDAKILKMYLEKSASACTNMIKTKIFRI